MDVCCIFLSYICSEPYAPQGRRAADKLIRGKRDLIRGKRDLRHTRDDGGTDQVDVCGRHQGRRDAKCGFRSHPRLLKCIFLLCYHRSHPRLGRQVNTLNSLTKLAHELTCSGRLTSPSDHAATCSSSGKSASSCCATCVVKSSVVKCSKGV